MASLKDYLFYEEPGITLYCGDCREVLPLLDQGVAAIITDPPYGVEFSEYESHDDDAGRYKEFIWTSIEIAERLIIDGWCVVFQSAKRASEWGAFFPRPFRPLALPKTFIQIQGKHSPLYATDYALFWTCGRPTWPSLDYSPRDNFTSRTHDPRNGPGSIGHPCPRPLGGMKYLIETFAAPNSLVCDPFVGSGTTLEAAKDRGRRAIGIEIEPKYCEIAVKRLRQEVLALS